MKGLAPPIVVARVSRGGEVHCSNCCVERRDVGGASYCDCSLWRVPMYAQYERGRAKAHGFECSACHALNKLDSN